MINRILQTLISLLKNCSLFKAILARIRKLKESSTTASSLDTRPIIAKASRDGKMTGFEPRKLHYQTIGQHDLMYGDPGLGLSSSSFSQSTISLGQKGELNFAKALQKNGILDKLLTFWSVHNLGLNDEKLNADIDCIIVSANTIWLIDLKYYASGDVLWKTSNGLLYTIDKETGAQVGKPKKMSKNMYLAEQRFKEKFATLSKYFKIYSRVVFMPTDKGSGELDSVFWPGDIKAVTLEDMLAELKQQPVFQDTIGGQKIKQIFNVIRKRR